MNMYLIIGLIVLLVGVLVYNRRKRSASGAGDASVASALPPAPAPASAPAPPAPLPRPAALRNESGSAAVHAPPPPSNWIPEETIVEPGWPLPGEIAGNWSPVTTDAGAAAAVRDPAPVAAVVLDGTEPLPVLPVDAAVESPDEWLMPESPAASWPAPVEEPAPLSVTEPEPEPEFAFAPHIPEPVVAETAATTWDALAVEMDTPVWTPPPAPAWPAEEAIAPEPEPEPEPAPPLVETPPPAPVVWNLDAPAQAPAAPEPEPEPEPVVALVPQPLPEPPAEPAPAVAEWVDPLPQAAPPVDVRDQSLAVAELAPLLEGLLPLTRISDRTGVTPRMLALMRTLAEAPLSVTEQARRLDVSRPVVADLCARLESMGLARRERDEADRRRVRIALTDRGRRCCEEAPSAPDPAAVEAALARMEPSEREGLVQGFRALERVAAGR